MHSAEVAIAKAQAAADGKREVEKEVAEIRKYKDFRERNEEERDLIIQAAKACMFDVDGKLLPAEEQDRANFARCMTVAAQLTAQIKPICTDATIQQTTNINMASTNPFDKLEGYKKYFSDIEHDTDRKGAAGSDNTG